MQFIHQPLTWAFFLVLLPLLIHLINLMRQKHVDWAAMEFLLQAYKKHRKWVWLKQFMLLMARMLAIAAVVAMLAKLVTQREWTRLFGGKVTHHFVLLDDSFSMSERLGAVTAFDRASQVVGRIAQQTHTDAAGQGATRFTLLRYSRAARAPQVPTAVDDERRLSDALASVADMNAMVVDSGFEAMWTEKQRQLAVSQLSVGPESALQLVTQLANQRSGNERPIVHIVSDFRTDPWSHPREAETLLKQLEETGAAINLVRCVDSFQSNLAITALDPAPGIVAAGVPLFVDVAVHNFGTEAVQQVPVSVETAFYGGDATADDPANSTATRESLPDILFDRIGPGESVRRRVQVFFPTAGRHALIARLPADAIAADNTRWSVISFPESVPVLIIDNDPTRRNAAYLTSVFQPSQRVATGIRTVTESMAFLRDTSPEELSKFRTIYLLDTERPTGPAQRNLESYVRSGGGLAIFLGPNSGPKDYREWYDGGKGLFPVAVQRMDLLPTAEDDTPDLIVDNHPLFKVLLGERNPFLGSIRVRQYFRTRADWQPAAESGTRVLASLRNGQPLIVERGFGEGRVVTVLSTLAPIWNDWATGPSFVVFLLEMQSYLRAGDVTEAERIVGSPLRVDLAQQEFTPQVTFMVPGVKDDQRMQLIVDATSARADDPNMTAILGDQVAPSSGGGTDRAGIYEAWQRSMSGSYVVQRHALNIDPRDSDLALTTAQELGENLDIEKLQVVRAAELIAAGQSDERFALSNILLYGLVALLLGEQALAYSASYHPPWGTKP